MSDYAPADGSIRICNGPRQLNRPIYGEHGPGVVLTGDRPVLRLLHVPVDCGLTTFGFVRAGISLPLTEFNEIVTEFRAGRSTWRLTDPRFPHVELSLEVVALAGQSAQGQGSWAAGYVATISLDSALPGDRIRWTQHLPQAGEDANLLWAWDPNEHPEISESKTLSEPTGAIMAAEGGFDLYLGTRVVSGRSTQALPAAAGSSDSPAKFVVDCDLSAGIVEIAVRSSDDNGGFTVHSLPAARDQSHAFARARSTLIVTTTPDPHLDAMVPFAGAASDASFYPPHFVHGAMSWNKPYLGWRGRYGATVLGMGARLIGEAADLLPEQQQDDACSVGFSSDDFTRGSLVSRDSRFYGRGHIPVLSEFYNMQEVYFDQLIHAWEWTGSAALEDLLASALPAHVEWMRECFDPDGTGLYESYLNVWSSDSVWYDGSGTAQSSAYAYRAHGTLAEILARRNDRHAAEVHFAAARRIRDAVTKDLWADDLGHLAEARERTTGTLHTSTSVNSVFLPIDADLLPPIKRAQMLHYSRWALERHEVDGGELCWTSNWVPYEWSVRELDFADTLHLALAHFQGGEAAEAHKLLFGALHESGFRSMTPGGIVLAPAFPDRGLEPWRQGRATDFADTVGCFLRAIVEGLFGIKHRAHVGRVNVRPQFPQDWDHAHIQTLDTELTYRREPDTEIVEIALSGAARMIEVVIPIRGREVCGVRIDDVPTRFEVRAGLHCSEVVVVTEPTRQARLVVELAGQGHDTRGDSLPCIDDETLTIDLQGRELVDILDPQSVVQILDATLHLHPRSTPTLVRLTLRSGSVESYHDLHVGPSAAESLAREMNGGWGPWVQADISSSMNCDLPQLYKQKYSRTDRVAVSARVGTDGYSPWTHAFWGLEPRAIELLSTAVASRGTPFVISDSGPSAAMTSTFDQWPDSLAIPLSATGPVEIALLLVASTSHMKTGVDNAQVIVVGREGEVERHPVRHPDHILSIAATYDPVVDRFVLHDYPETVELGRNCRATVFRLLSPPSGLTALTVATLSPEVMVGVVAVSTRAAATGAR